MAIYKPSNLVPNLQEVDITQDTQFSCMVNTSGSAVQAYKMTMYSGSGDEKIFDQNPTNLPKPIRNKGQLAITAKSKGSSVTINGVDHAMLAGKTLVNGKDYQWNVRTYEAPVGSTAQPQTQVCTGFLTGSTQYVIWTRNNPKIETDYWIEFTTTGPNQIFPIVGPNEENIVLPQAGQVFRQRRQIYWAEKDLGWNKDIMKLEIAADVTDSEQTGYFTYSYKNNTPFTIYHVSDKHTLTTLYAEPNDEIQRGRFIQLYNASGQAVGSRVKIIGYGELTGEIRVQQAWPQVPQNGWTFDLFKYDAIANTYTAVGNRANNIVGGKAVTDAGFVTIANQWDNNLKQLFIQPNINIKTDKTNPNEIVFENGVRLDIIQNLSTAQIPGKTTDITFNKLDNTQWLLTAPNVIQAPGTSGTVPVAPRTPYTVFTDFMDSMPNAVMYARQAPTITLQVSEFDVFDTGDPVYTNLVNDTTYNWRDIRFRAVYSSPNQVQIRSYKYILYNIDAYDNLTVIGETEDIYDTELTWFFRGFETSRRYKIEIQITDQYGNVYEQEGSFTTIYQIQNSVVPLYTQYDCKEHGIRINAYPPLFVETTSTPTQPTIGPSNIHVVLDVNANESGRYADTSDGTILNYTNIINSARTPIELPNKFTYLTRFGFPRAEEAGERNFFMYFNGEDMRTITAISVENPSEFWVNTPNSVLTNILANPGSYSGIYLSLINEDNEEFDGKREIESYDSTTGQILLKAPFSTTSFNGVTYRIFGYNSTNDTFEIIPYSGDNTVQVGSDLYELQIGSIDTYTIQDAGIRVNPNRLKLKVFKNQDYNNPLYCFNSGQDNYRDITQYIPDFTTPGGISFVLQDGSQYVVVDVLPPAIDESYIGRQYLLLRDCVIGGVTYYQGIYQVKNISHGNTTGYQWVLMNPTSYFFFDSTTDAGTDVNGVPYTYARLGVPMALRADPTAEGGAINWGDVAIGENGDAGYIWMPDGETTMKQNLRQLAQQWFTFYMVVDPSNTETPVLCNVRVDEGGAL